VEANQDQTANETNEPNPLGDGNATPRARLEEFRLRYFPEDKYPDERSRIARALELQRTWNAPRSQSERAKQNLALLEEYLSSSGLARVMEEERIQAERRAEEERQRARA